LRNHHISYILFSSQIPKNNVENEITSVIVSVSTNDLRNLLLLVTGHWSESIMRLRSCDDPWL